MELQRLLVGDRGPFGRAVEIVGHEQSSSKIREPRRERREGAKSSTRASVRLSPMTGRRRPRAAARAKRLASSHRRIAERSAREAFLGPGGCVALRSKARRAFGNSTRALRVDSERSAGGRAGRERRSGSCRDDLRDGLPNPALAPPTMSAGSAAAGVAAIVSRPAPDDRFDARLTAGVSWPHGRRAGAPQKAAQA